MTSFELLNPALQHHIVNSLGWRELRPFQNDVIPPLLEGKHAIVLAPTAGGKTEAAFFPVVSRMLSEGWTGLSVLYVCPIKALLNNLETRLQHYSNLLGRRTALWHGDVKASERRRILREPPDCLLTTPESLEVMLVSSNVDARSLFSGVRVVIVDEVHAFAGDDRGWHLLAVLERISRLAGREIQRIGLSATVGNPNDLLKWLAGPCSGDKVVYKPSGQEADTADVHLDYVGSLSNAAVVISRLHRGEKRLVFVDSRARAEQIGLDLRSLGVTTYVTHSSLSQEQRRDAETAFAERDDCVIVATSVLELGVDVGDLDRVIQIDAPTTVSSFLQRMGRTGRRSGTVRNCLFLATTDEALIQAAALIDLWSAGFIESIEPPMRPFHILAQQLMALALQERGIGRAEWFGWICRVPGFASISEDEIDQMVAWMLDEDILFDDEGILWFGRKGEEEFGRRNFMELLSVFTSPPLFSVLHGRHELGFVDELTFMAKQDGLRVLLLGGRAWKVNHIDWPRKVAHVEPINIEGRSRWKGRGPGLEFELCQQMKAVLISDNRGLSWSDRTGEAFRRIRDEYTWLHDSKLPIAPGGNGNTDLWTFSGMRVNATLARTISEALQVDTAYDSFKIMMEYEGAADAVVTVLRHIDLDSTKQLRPLIDDRAIDGLKFSQCVPRQLAVQILESRLRPAGDALRLTLPANLRK